MQFDLLDNDQIKELPAKKLYRGFYLAHQPAGPIEDACWTPDEKIAITYNNKISIQKPVADDDQTSNQIERYELSEYSFRAKSSADLLKIALAQHNKIRIINRSIKIDKPIQALLSRQLTGNKNFMNHSLRLAPKSLPEPDHEKLSSKKQKISVHNDD